MSVKPYAQQEGTKKEQVTAMFNRIAPKYDLLNRLLSFGIDKIWRRRVVKLISQKRSPIVLDVATGTGDLAIALAEIKPKPTAVYAVDISSGMLDLAGKKVLKKGLQHAIVLKEADSESLPFSNNYFDAITVAFGVRNFGDLNQGLSEMYRVLKPGGTLIVLEFSKPSAFPMKQLYSFYFSQILPRWGGWISKDKEAYSYLPASVFQFPEGQKFDDEIQRVGLVPVRRWRQSGGIATIYVSEKPLQ
ncbi:bifunctional demethylmenaquinone methyltransferase/2-methoxy-6-polyprenyl-1,4-benzoquinol methylase UbiE [Geofilum rubicundum]|uniref:Demethylmenaquinone methyltransferase n=1 Tax=Geofilum rubicundum JCM 15548 TaxID=1236989 RepID=A0A0E9LVG5_9BACT|nr:bifunctional demethylmenaquinone methyltransferase/2-methoxy-6-polyprenyl-1,4-benzoquinol methylase UbiE [Geofilum rubicundum]GAO29562.1 ubiquinone/menaquinone biosynthesis methyltransferase UbiE [Geofilum rubicundum JCM 15548]